MKNCILQQETRRAVSFLYFWSILIQKADFFSSVLMLKFYSLSESVKNVKVSVGVSGATPGYFLGLVRRWGELHHPVPATEDEPRPWPAPQSSRGCHGHAHIPRSQSHIQCSRSDGGHSNFDVEEESWRTEPCGNFLKFTLLELIRHTHRHKPLFSRVTSCFIPSSTASFPASSGSGEKKRTT